MYATDFDRKVTAKCGCVVQLDVEVDSPSCRCSGDCYANEYEFDYSEIFIVEPCAMHLPKE